MDLSILPMDLSILPMERVITVTCCTKGSHDKICIHALIYKLQKINSSHSKRCIVELKHIKKYLYAKIILECTWLLMNPKEAESLSKSTYTNLTNVLESSRVIKKITNTY